MSCTIIVQSEEAKDRAATLRNRARHGVNKIFFSGIANFTVIS